MLLSILGGDDGGTLATGKEVSGVSYISSHAICVSEDPCCPVFGSLGKTFLSYPEVASIGICEQMITVQFKFYPTMHSPEASRRQGMPKRKHFLPLEAAGSRPALPLALGGASRVKFAGTCPPSAIQPGPAARAGLAHPSEPLPGAVLKSAPSRSSPGSS